MYGKKLIKTFHTISKDHWKKIRTNSCGFLNQIKQSGDKTKTMFLFLEKNAYHTILYTKLYD